MGARGLLVLLLGVAGCSWSSTSARLEQSQARAKALASVHDFEIARRAHATRLVELEGLHELEPDDRELLLELVRAWVTETELFTTDDLEMAADREAASESLYHQQRVESGFTRASFWGREWLSTRAPSLNLSASTADLARMLESEFTDEEDAEPLLWLGHALFGAGSAELRRASELVLERSIALDESVHFASAHTLLGRKYAVETPPDFERSRQHFARAEALAGNKLLLTQFYHASVYHCRQGNQADFNALLNEVLRASDPEPAARLENAAAKRRAQRWTLSSPLSGSCAFAASAFVAEPAREDR